MLSMFLIVGNDGKDANLWSLGENEITELINNFNILLTKNN